MIESLTNTISRVDQVVVTVRRLDFLPINEYRCSAMRLMRLLADEEIRDHLSELRRFLWIHVAQVLRSPCEWTDAWRIQAADRLAEAETRTVGGDAIASAALDFLRTIGQLQACGVNPLREAFLSSIDSMPEVGKAAVLLPPRRDLASVFTSITHQCLRGTRLLTEAQLRQRSDSYSCLITLGRFDDFTPHHIFSAPNWQRILNLRWSGDRDDEETLPVLPLFSVPPTGPADEGVAKDSRTCSWVKWEADDEVVPFNRVVDLGGTQGPTAHWDAPHFDDLFRPNRRERDQTLKALYSGNAVWVGFSDGTGFYVGVDEDGRPRPVWVLDEEEGARIAYRLVLPGESKDSRPVLEEGLIASVPISPKPGVVREMTYDLTRRLRRWKVTLASRVAKYNARHVADELRRHGLAYDAFENAVLRWSYEPAEINAPQSEHVFRILVKDYLGMRHSDCEEEIKSPWWKLAWDDILELKRRNGSAGQQRRWQKDTKTEDVFSAEHIRIVDEVNRLGKSFVEIDEAYTLVCGRVEHIDRGVDGRGHRVEAEDCGYYLGLESGPDDPGG